MDEKALEELLAEGNEILNSCKKAAREDEVMNEQIAFLINEYKTNKQYFREEAGEVTIEDIIRTAVQFGWTCKRNYDLHPKAF